MTTSASPGTHWDGVTKVVKSADNPTFGNVTSAYLGTSPVRTWGPHQGVPSDARIKTLNQKLNQMLFRPLKSTAKPQTYRPCIATLAEGEISLPLQQSKDQAQTKSKSRVGKKGSSDNQSNSSLTSVSSE
jgi:hypothetical protein